MQWKIPANFTTGMYILRIKGADANWNDTGIIGDSAPFRISKGLDLKTKVGIFKKIMEQNTAIAIKTVYVANLPDLMLYAEELKYIDWENKIVRYHIAIKNQGNKEAKNIPIKLSIYRRGVSKEVGVVGGEIKSIPPGMTVSWSREYKLKNIGIYDFIFKVNYFNSIKELRYDNNESKPKTIKREALPDLITWLITTKAQQFVPKIIKFGVQNIGQSVSRGTKLRVSIEHIGSKMYDIPALRAGEMYIVESRETFNIAKDATVELVIDPYNKVKEGKERNNYLVKKIKIIRNAGF
jgi:hypothetical protein